MTDTAQTVQQVKQAGSKAKDNRTKVLAAAAAAMAISNAASGGMSATLSATVGSSQSHSDSIQTSQIASGSSLNAGGNFNLVATGGGQDSNLTLQGSDISAGQNINLTADNAINLIADQNSTSQVSHNSSSSNGAGVAASYGSGGSAIGITANAAAARGNADGNDLSYTNSHVNAGNTLNINSGGDTTLKGASATGKQIVANIGGNLNLESLQDTSTYTSKQRSAGISVLIPIVGSGSASVNAAKSKITSTYASVNEQSGFKAGDGGFQIDVKGNTNLKGAVIASNQTATDQQKNSLTTAILTVSDIRNKAEYDANGASATIGAGLQAGLPQLSGAGIGSDSDKASSTTVSAISQGSVNITDNEAQQDLTGKDANITVALLNRDVHVNEQGEAVDSQGNSTANTIAPIFDAEKVAKEIQAQVQITGAFNQQANKAVGDYIASQITTLKEQLKAATSETDKAIIKDQMDDLTTQERVMNILIGAVTGQGATTVTKEGLSMAADQMRQLMIEDSKKFAGVVDKNGKPLFSNLSGDSAGSQWQWLKRSWDAGTSPGLLTRVGSSPLFI